MKNVFALFVAILILAAAGFTQTAPETAKPQPIISERVLIGDQASANPIFLLTEMDGVGKVVKGAPYTANAVTETTQTLGDGNRIVNKSTAFLARDSEGRTRREESFTKVGSLQANASKVVMINDPVAHLQYMYQPNGEATVISTDTKGDKLYFKTVGPEMKDKAGPPGGKVFFHRTLGNAEITEDSGGSTNVKHESLGTQVMEGLTVEGTRDTKTIPAGAIGNEKPIVITSETWASPDLQTVVLSKRNDPRFGETVYQLTEVNRSEPDAGLFQVPGNVKKEPLKY